MRRESALDGWLAAFHSTVFAIFPMLALLSGTAGTFPIRPDLAVRPLLLGMAVNALLFLTLRPLVASPSQRGAILSVAYIGLHLHVVVSRWNQGMVLWWIPAPLLAALHVAAAIALVAVVVRSGPKPNRSRLLVAAAGALLVTNAVQAGLARGQLAREAWVDEVDAIAASGRFTVVPGAPRPDIVHVVLDGLGSPWVLREFYGLDTGRWTRELESAGFTVLDRAHSNYVHTYSSMASLLSASYLDPLEAPLGDRPTRFPLRAVIDGSGVIRSLRDAGYEFTLVGSPYSATDSHPLATRCDCAVPPMAELEGAFMRSSVFRTVAPRWLTYEPHRRRVFEQLEAVRAMPEAGPPQYLLAHIISPHPPFAFDEGGQLPSGRLPLFGLQDASDFPGTREEYRSRYRAQAIFVLDQTAALARALAARTRPTAIVISGDHGPGLFLDHAEAGRSDLRERLGTFFAIHVPGRAVAPPDDLTLVNTYRLLAREALGAQMDLLRNRGYFTTFEAPYRFVRVDGAALAQRSVRHE